MAKDSPEIKLIKRVRLYQRLILSEKKRNDAPPPRLRAKKGARGKAKLSKLPTVAPVMKCRLKSLKMERIKDYLLLEEEFIKNQEIIKKAKLDENEEDVVDEERAQVDEMRETPLSIASLEEFVDDNHAVISAAGGV